MTEELEYTDNPQADNDDKVYFAVTVTKRRAEYLYKCLQQPLCGHCGREQAECDADPCETRVDPSADAHEGWRKYRPPKI